jgi:hypothetical protein
MLRRRIEDGCFLVIAVNSAPFIVSTGEPCQQINARHSARGEPLRHFKTAPTRVSTRTREWCGWVSLCVNGSTGERSELYIVRAPPCRAPLTPGRVSPTWSGRSPRRRYATTRRAGEPQGSRRKATRLGGRPAWVIEAMPVAVVAWTARSLSIRVQGSMRRPLLAYNIALPAAPDVLLSTE